MNKIKHSESYNKVYLKFSHQLKLSKECEKERVMRIQESITINRFIFKII